MARPRSTKNSTKRSSYEDILIEDLEAKGIGFGYESEKFYYVVTRYYKPDLFFYNTKIAVEAKGYFLPSDRSKALKVRSAMREEGWELRFLFQDASKTLGTKKRPSTTTYGDWCDKHGFIWAEGNEVPKEWYEK